MIRRLPKGSVRKAPIWGRAMTMEPEPLVLDVREDIGNGREPFPRIMAAVRSLNPGQALVLIAPFEPRPLYDVLQAQGFSYTAERTGDGDWHVTFCSRR